MRNKNDSVSSRTISIIIACVVVLPPFLFWLLGPMGLNLLAKIGSNSEPKDNISNVINWFNEYGVILNDTVSNEVILNQFMVLFKKLF